MKARIAIVSISSLVSLALVIGLIGCLELGLNPTSEPTATPVPTPTHTATPKPTSTPYVKSVYDVETKIWSTVTPTATPVPPTPIRIQARVVYTATPILPTSTPIPPTPTITPTPTLTPIPDRYPVSDENERMKAFLADFEPLTDENDQIAFCIANPYCSAQLELPNGDILYLGIEATWITIGQKHHFIASLMHRCFDGVEYPPIREQLEVRQRHVGWDRLEFIRDASQFDYGYVGVQFGERGWEVESLYRVAEDRWVLAEAGFSIETCGMGSFGFTELVKNTRGYLANPRSAPSPSCGVRLDNPDEYDICGGGLRDEFKRSEMLDPITNIELETGYIRCRGDNCNDFELLTPENEEVVRRALSHGEVELPNGDTLEITGDVPNWIKAGYHHYHIASFMHRCLDGVEHPEARDQLDTQRVFYGWDTLEFVRDASHEYFSAATAFDSAHGRRRVESIYRIAEDKWLLVISEISESTCEMHSFGYSELGKNAEGRFVQLQYTPPSILPMREDIDRWEWLLPITNTEAETRRFGCREVGDDGHYKFCD